MKIIEILPRRKHLTALKFDCDFLPDKPRLDATGLLVLDSEFLEEQFLKVGTELTEEQICRLFSQSEMRKAKSKALWLLSRRDYSSGELFSKLKTDFGTEAAEYATERMKELGLINDEAYAEKLARILIEEKGVSPRSAPYLMKEKGVELSLAKKAVDERGDDPKQGIRRILEKKYSGKLNDEKELRRAFSALQRKGYSYSDIKNVLREYTSEEFGDYGYGF